MQVTVRGSYGIPCYDTAISCYTTISGTVRPVGASCALPRKENDPFYANQVFSQELGPNGGTINRTFTFSPGAYKDAQGIHPVAPGPILLCGYGQTTMILDGGQPFGGVELLAQVEGYYGASPTPTAADTPKSKKKKCKKKRGKKKRKKCRKRARRLRR